MNQTEVKELLSQNDKLWQDKMGSALNEFKDKIGKTQEKYKNEMETQQKNHQKVLDEDESTFKKSLAGEQKKIESLDKIQTKEVDDIFENEHNLAFIKSMRGFKKQWSSDHGVAKRKSTAA